MNKETDDLILEFIARGGNPEDWRPSYSIAPTNHAPIIRERVNKATDLDETSSGDPVSDFSIREIELASWGLKPAWAKPGGPAPINARLESVATNGMFRSAFASQRCIVPMTGYFEWKEMADGKQPYFIHSETELLAAAGLYSARRDGDEWKVTFTIITREAQDASGEVHDRMPVFLTPDTWQQWLDPLKLDPRSSAKDEMLDLIDRSSEAVAASITTYPVDRRINNTRTVDRFDAGLLDPIEL